MRHCIYREPRAGETRRHTLSCLQRSADCTQRHVPGCLIGGYWHQPGRPSRGSLGVDMYIRPLIKHTSLTCWSRGCYPGLESQYSLPAAGYTLRWLHLRLAGIGLICRQIRWRSRTWPCGLVCPAPASSHPAPTNRDEGMVGPRLPRRLNRTASTGDQAPVIPASAPARRASFAGCANGNATARGRAAIVCGWARRTSARSGSRRGRTGARRAAASSSRC